MRCDEILPNYLQPMEPYFASMAGATATDWGPDVKPPALSANVTLPGMEVYVDLAELIDVEAEITRKKQELEKLTGLIAAKQKKLENKNFVDRAPAEVVQKERDSLKRLESIQIVIAGNTQSVDMKLYHNALKSRIIEGI